MDPGASPAAATITTTSTTTVLGKYTLGKLLGRGSFAKVYRASSAEDPSSPPVAIKIIDKSKLDPAVAPKILSEVSAMRRLNHPNIIRLHEVLATKSKIFLVMDLAPNGDLHNKLLRRPDRRFPDRLARRFFHQIVSALQFCHRHGVAHRDIKPGNILLDANSDVKLSDFGLSNEDKNLLFTTACGTPAFAAPEVMMAGARRAGAAYYDGAKADSWSCGVMLYTMLVGALPFDDRNLAVMYRKTYRREFGFPDHVTRAARALICQLLDPNPETRMSVEGIGKSAWFRSGQFGPRSLSLGDLVLESESRVVERVSNSSVSAFDIIGMNSGLDLSGLFEDGIGEKERRFRSEAGEEEVVERVVEVGGKLGYEVEKGKGGKIWLGRGKLVLVVEVLKLGPELLVEMRVVQGGGCAPCGGGGAGGACGVHGGGIGESQWGEIKDGLGDVVASWHNVEAC